MKRTLSLLVCAVALAACATGAWAQAPAAFDLSGSVSYMHIPAADSRPPTTAIGWNAALDLNAAHPFGAEIQAAGFYGLNLFCQGCAAIPEAPEITFATDGYTFVAGPRWQWRRSPSAPVPFLHALIGVDHIVAGTPRGAGPLTSFAYVLGGGLDVPLSRSLALRLSADYLIIRTPVAVMIPSGNIRFSAGLVFRFRRK